MFSFNKEASSEIRCADEKDFRRLYDATMQLLFKVSYKIVNDEEAAARRIQQGANLLWMNSDAIYMTQAIAKAAKAVAEL